MKALADVAASNGGNVLEVGFGLGVSAGYIQKSKKLVNHFIVEPHPEIIKYAIRLFPDSLQSGRMNLIQGFWEDVLPYFEDGQFDGILFDTNPLSQETQFFHFFPFFKDAFRLLKDGGVFTYFSDETEKITPGHLELLQQVGFKDVKYKICHIKPPKSCRYWSSDTIVVPIVHK